MDSYDLIIIGGGMAGLTAAVYGARAGLQVLVLERETCGGLANLAAEIENFPSREKISGLALMELVKAQAEEMGAEIREIIDIEGVCLKSQPKSIQTDEGVFQARAIIVATGREPIPLPIAVDSEHIHYCAVCDGAAYRGRDILVVGGGNTGVYDALYLLNQGVGRITLIEKADRLLATRTSQESLLARSEVTVLTSTEVVGIETDQGYPRVTLRNTRTRDSRMIGVEGIFVYIGQRPKTALFKDILAMDNEGYILGNELMHTNLRGVFVAGDVRKKKYRQLTTAMNDGTIAALEAEVYIHSRDQATGLNS